MDKALKKYVLPILSVLAIIAIDQWTKLLTLKYVKDTQGFYIINKILRIFFVKNEGMAWGMLQNKQIVFIIITPIVIAALIYIFYKMPFDKKYVLMRICLIFLTGGAIGNLIDRVDILDREALLGGVFTAGNVFHGYVVDMIYAEIINFPVFNIADSFITVGFALLMISILFIYKEKDFEFIFGKKTDADVETSDSKTDNEELKEESSTEIKEESSAVRKEDTIDTAAEKTTEDTTEREKDENN